MIVIYLLLVICLEHVESTDATREHDSGYVGCSTFGAHWQNLLENDYRVTSVDDCVSHCCNKNTSYSAILIGSCYCSNHFENVSKVHDRRCNVNCNSKPNKTCGSMRHFSVYNTTERLLSPGLNTPLNCLTCCRLKESTYVPCIDSALGSTTMSGQIRPTCTTTSGKDSNAKRECIQKPVDECCSCQHLWLRIVIDLAVILGLLFLTILILLIVRFCRNRQRGMFDEWKPLYFRQTRKVESGSSRSGDDLLHRNHSYRNLLGSSTLGRDLESVEQDTAAMKDASARNPRAVNTNLKKPTTGTSPAEMPTKGNSGEGEYYEPDSLLAPDQPGYQQAPPDSESKPKLNSKTCQKERAEDTAKVEDTVLVKSKRRSLFNIISTGSRMPSSFHFPVPGPSKDEEISPKDPVPIMDRPLGSPSGKKSIKKSEGAERRKSCSVSKDEKVFEDPKSNTLANDIYALPTKPACRNKQPKKMSDTTKGAKPGDVELQEEYGRLSRLFKPRAIEKVKSKRGDGTKSPEEYSVLHPGSKDTEYDKLRRRGDTDGPVAVDKAKTACKPDEGMYASVDDNEYAVVGEGTPPASQSSSKDTDYDMLSRQGDTDGPAAVHKAESACKPDEGIYASVDDNGYAVIGEGMPAASQSGDYEMVTRGQIK